MKTNWFDGWILEPLLTLPAIVLDPFTLYCWATLENELDGVPSSADDDPAAVEERR